MKRRTINDYFSESTAERPTKLQRAEKESKPNQQVEIPGLHILPNFVTVDEEIDLLTFLDDQHWRTDLSRRVIHYGGTYCLMAPRTASAEERKAIEDTILKADPIPKSFSHLISRMIENDLFQATNEPTYCIVNEYRLNQGISAHVENFRFVSPVCGLTLGKGDWIRFHELTLPDDGSVRSGKAAQAKRTGRRADIWMPSRSLLVMSGDARERWQHEIVRSKKGRSGPEWRRVSLTFRAEKQTAG